MTLAPATAVTRLVTQRTRVMSPWDSVLLPRPRENGGPTLYPVAKRKRSKKTTFTSGSTFTPIWPTTTPARSVPTTLPRLKPPKRRRPMAKPMARVRNTASSGFSRTFVTNHSIRSLPRSRSRSVGHCAPPGARRARRSERLRLRLLLGGSRREILEQLVRGLGHLLGVLLGLVRDLVRRGAPVQQRLGFRVEDVHHQRADLVLVHGGGGAAHAHAAP